MQWLKLVMEGYFNYYGMPGNMETIGTCVGGSFGAVAASCPSEKTRLRWWRFKALNHR